MELEWKVASFTPPGFGDSGDLAFVKTTGVRAIVAVIDGLGHGQSAGEAAQLARLAIDRHVAEPIADIVRHCDRALADTRGVVMSIVEFDGALGRMAWCGIGNVQGVLCHASRDVLPNRHELLLRAGVVGAGPQQPHVERLQILPFDLLVLGTDGLRRSFADDIDVAAPPSRLAPALLDRHCLRNDDALVLVARVN